MHPRIGKALNHDVDAKVIASEVGDPVEKLKTPLFASSAMWPRFPAEKISTSDLHGFILGVERLHSEPIEQIESKLKLKKYLIAAVSAALMTAWSGLCSAQSDAPYTEGPVWQITMVKTKPGMDDEYLKGIAKTFKGSLDEAKKQNLILDYKIMIGEAATSQDFNILLMVESPNMAALDNAREKFDPIARKITGSPAAQLAAATKRLEIREIMGAKLMREITLK
jgi:hypothetical protein